MAIYTRAVCPKDKSQNWGWYEIDDKGKIVPIGNWAVQGKRKCEDCGQVFFVSDNPDTSKWPDAAMLPGSG